MSRPGRGGAALVEEHMPNARALLAPRSMTAYHEATIDLIHHRSSDKDRKWQQGVHHRKYDAVVRLKSSWSPAHDADHGHVVLPRPILFRPEQDKPGEVLDQSAGQERQQHEHGGYSLLPYFAALRASQ